MRVFITRLRDMREVEYRSEWTEGSYYWWTEGNGSCDCNRAIFFASASGEPEEDAPCGETRYSVRLE